MRMAFKSLALATAAGAVAAFFSTDAQAQYGPPQGGPGYGPPQGGYYPPPPPMKKQKKKSTTLEIGTLYATSVAWGVGTGIWIDALAEIDDPGLALIAPGVLGLAAPVAVYILDNPHMDEGLPSSIAVGMIIGAGEGLGITSYQYVAADEDNEWGFKVLTTAEVTGSTLGGLAGFAAWYYLRPHPKTTTFWGSSIFWGTAIGSLFGGGASNGDWGEANDSVAIGGLIGFNVALAGAAGLSTVWQPSWEQHGWMWGGLALGAAVSTPVYIFYAGSDADPRRGLIFQGVAATLGLGAGVLIGRPDKKGAIAELDTEPEEPGFVEVLGAAPMNVPGGGVGAQVYGNLW